MYLLVAAFLLVLTGSTYGQSSVLIENVTVLSADDLESSNEKFVLLTNGRISQISNVAIEAQQETKRIDGSGKFLTPGILDSHVHVSSIPGLGFASEEKAQQHSDLVDAYFFQQPRSYLYHGVTQVIDPNPGASWRRFSSSATKPDYFRCEVVTSPFTFPYVERPAEVTGKLYSYLVSDSESNISDDDSPESVVARIAESGAICVKLYFEDGYGNSSQWPLLSAETLERITGAAHSHNLLVVAHANALDMYENALAEDIDVLAHGLWAWGADNSFDSTPASVISIMETVAQKRLGFMPTLRIVAGLGELMEPDRLEQPAFRKVTPTLLQEWYRQPEAQWFKSELLAAEDLSPQLFARIYRLGIVGRGIRAMQHLDSLGYPLLLGSDTPGSPSYINQPGLNTYHELLLMAEGGISLDDIFVAATINTARQFRLDADYGTIEVGKMANLLLLSENPLEAIEAWDSIDTIFLHGVPIKRDELLAN